MSKPKKNKNKPTERSLLPDNSTPFEEAFEDASAQLVASEQHFDWLTDPMKTKASLLDIMAKQAGVVDWYREDNDAMKRTTIEGARRFLKLSGSKKALRDSLSAIGIEIDFVDATQAYLIEIEGFVADTPITPDLLARSATRVSTYKSEADTVNLRLTRVSNSSLITGAAAQVSDYVFYGAAP